MSLVPPAAGNEAEAACFLAGSYGLVPDEWQALVLEGWLGVTRAGKWASPRCGLAVPRQNGKNGILEVRELFGMAVLGERFLHTAHEVKTARKAFLRIASFFENERQYPELAGQLKEVRRTNGQEAVVLTNGGSVEFIARSRGSGRGYSVDVLVMDEAQELTDESLAALLPTISVSPNPQQILTGTPPGPNDNGEVFTRVRNDGVEGKASRLCWHEWSCDGVVDLDSRAAWADANPALGDRLSFDTVADERAAMDDETFSRERLGMWQSASTSAVIPPAVWVGTADAGSTVEDPVAFAVDIPPSRDSASIGLAGRRADGLFHVEVVKNQRGTGWVVDALAALSERWGPAAIVIDTGGPAGSLLPALEERGVQIVKASTNEMKQACGGFFDAVMEQRLRHLDQPLLNTAVASARKRELQDAWAWHRKDNAADITPLVAVTLALWGFAHSAALPKPRQPARLFAF